MKKKSMTEINEQKRFVHFTDKDGKVLSSIKPVIEPHIPELVERFFHHINQYSELKAPIDHRGASIHTLKQEMSAYLLDIFGGVYDEPYFEKRAQTGQAHSVMGLPSRWYLGAYHIFSTGFSEIIDNKYWYLSPKRHKALNAVRKIMNLDLQLVMDSYIDAISTNMEKSSQQLESRVDNYGSFIEKVAGGDLKARLGGVDDDNRISKLGRSLNSMVESLATMVGQTRGASSELQVNVGEVQNAVISQSNGIAQQASALNETTSTLSEIRATSEQTLEMAQNLGQITARTQEESEQGRKAVEDTIAGMGAIREKVEGIAHTILSLSEQTQQIGDITDVVNGLAQQLKMLALNASIEASKAGEAGKGFGVVATEVKELAEQSQQSTAQVQKILEDIRHATDRAVMATEEGSKGVDIGVELVNKTGTTMGNLSGVIQEASSASQQIVTAVRQEVTGIDQINTAFSEINAVTSQFVESADQTKGAADGLSALAEGLSNNVSLFKI